MPENKPEEPEKTPEEIEREMYEARVSLEDNLDKFVHKVREKVSVKAKVDHVLAEKATPKTLLIAAVAGAGVALLLHRRHS